jgi:hypothetical protein
MNNVFRLLYIIYLAAEIDEDDLFNLMGGVVEADDLTTANKLMNRYTVYG